MSRDREEDIATKVDDVSKDDLDLDEDSSLTILMRFPVSLIRMYFKYLRCILNEFRQIK